MIKWKTKLWTWKAIEIKEEREPLFSRQSSDVSTLSILSTTYKDDVKLVCRQVSIDWCEIVWLDENGKTRFITTSPSFLDQHCPLRLEWQFLMLVITIWPNWSNTTWREKINRLIRLIRLIWRLIRLIRLIRLVRLIANDQNASLKMWIEGVQPAKRKRSLMPACLTSYNNNNRNSSHTINKVNNPAQPKT